MNCRAFRIPLEVVSIEWIGNIVGNDEATAGRIAEVVQSRLKQRVWIMAKDDIFNKPL